MVLMNLVEGRKKDTDVENGLEVTGGGGGWDAVRE